jgi:hypothetical protein
MEAGRKGHGGSGAHGHDHQEREADQDSRRRALVGDQSSQSPAQPLAGATPSIGKGRERGRRPSIH